MLSSLINPRALPKKKKYFTTLTFTDKYTRVARTNTILPQP